jgi:hypothetical protein
MRRNKHDTRKAKFHTNKKTKTIRMRSRERENKLEIQLQEEISNLGRGLSNYSSSSNVYIIGKKAEIQVWKTEKTCLS